MVPVLQMVLMVAELALTVSWFHCGTGQCENNLYVVLATNLLLVAPS